MELWFEYVDEVAIVSPTTYPEKVFLADFSIPVKVFKLPFFSFRSISECTKSLLLLPIIFYRIIRSFLWADHLHLRCPGNVGLIACVVQIFFPDKQKSVKYAGNWDPKSKQPWSYKIQKWILGNSFLTRKAKVLIYGEWQNKSKNIIPFFTASYSHSDIQKIAKDFSQPFKFVFVGTLSKGKRPLIAVKVLHELINSGFKVSLDIFGDGVERKKIENYISENRLKDNIRLHGNISKERLKEAYIESHFSILPSESEGWPKALAEGMFFGCIPIATSVSCVPWMLGNETRGLLISINKETNLEITKNSLINLKTLLEDPQEMEKKSLAGIKWSQQFTLERFKEGIESLLIRS